MDTTNAKAQYLLQALAIGIQLDEHSSSGPAGGRPRKQSLSQRLGFQQPQAEQLPQKPKLSPAEKGKGKEADAGESDEQQADRQSGSPPAENAGAAAIADLLGDKRASPAPSVSSQTQKQRMAKIECAEMVGGDLYVGTNDGRIVHYAIDTPVIGSGEVPENFRVNSVDLKMGGKRVEHIIAFPGMCRLVVLCSSTVLFYSLPELRPVPSMGRVKGVSCIAFDERADRSSATTVILCVARMRSIQVYRMASELRLEQEVGIDSSVASICQYGNYVCLADTETYKILDLAKIRATSVENGQLVLLPTTQPYKDEKTGKIVRPPRPRTLVVGPNEFMFLTSSGDETTLGVIITAMGEALRGTLQFTTYPKSIIYDDPNVIAIFGNGVVEVYDTRRQEQTLTQKLFAEPESDISNSSRPRKVCTVASTLLCTNVSRAEVIDGSAAGVRVTSPDLDASSLFRAEHKHSESEMDTKPWTAALAQSQHMDREMLGDNSVSAAHGTAGKALSRFTNATILVCAQDSVYTLANLPELVRVDRLLDEQKVEAALLLVDKALASDTSLNARMDEVAYCFQKAGAVCLKNMLLDDALQHFRRGSLDPRALLHLFPEYVDYLGALLIPFGRIPMAAGLRDVFYAIGDVDRLVEVGARQMAGESEDQLELLKQTLKDNAREMLERYLEYARLQMSLPEQPFAPDSVPVIDTVLARIYAESSQHDKLSSMIMASDNNIVEDFARDYFLQTHRYYYCSLFTRARKDTQGVLDIWRKLLTGEWEDEQFGGLAEYLEYIQVVNNQRVLLDEYYWLVSFDIGTSLQVLMYLTDESVASIDADKVIKEIEPYGDEPLRAFIERLIGAKHARAKHYMTYLAKVYVRQLRDFYLGDGEEARHSLKQLMDDYRCAQADDLSLTFRAYLESVCNQDAGTSLRSQLLAILCARPLSYDPGEVLDCVEQEARPLLLIERAVLLVILDRTNEAIDVLVKELQDYAEAEILLLRPSLQKSLAQMCQAHSDLGEDSDGDQDGYWLLHQQTATSIADELRTLALGTSVDPDNVRKLVNMYIALGEADDETAARLVSGLLARYGQFVDMDVLEQVPDSWQFSVIEKFVVSKFQKLAHGSQTSRVERSVRQSLEFQSRVEAVESSKNHGPVVLDYTQTCARCGKLLGSSAFALIPESNDILHLTCLG